MDIYCRYKINDSVHYGRVEGEKIFTLENEPWFEGRETGGTVPLSEVRLLNPSQPKVIIGLGASYREAWEDKDPPKSVRWFIKPPGAAASWNDDIFLPPSLDEVKVEVELVIVIGEKVKDASENESHNAIFGYTTGNDIVGTNESYYRMLNEIPGRQENLLPTGLKICDRFAPFGPFIYRNIEWSCRKSKLRIIDKSGQERINFENTTSGLLYTPGKIVSDLSKVLTLFPGDIVMTGTPRSFSAYPEEIVEVSVEGLGKLKNKLVSSK